MLRTTLPMLIMWLKLWYVNTVLACSCVNWGIVNWRQIIVTVLSWATCMINYELVAFDRHLMYVIIIFWSVWNIININHQIIETILCWITCMGNYQLVSYVKIWYLYELIWTCVIWSCDMLICSYHTNTNMWCYLY